MIITHTTKYEGDYLEKIISAENVQILLRQKISGFCPENYPKTIVTINKQICPFTKGKRGVYGNYTLQSENGFFSCKKLWFRRKYTLMHPDGSMLLSIKKNPIGGGYFLELSDGVGGDSVSYNIRQTSCDKSKSNLGKHKLETSQFRIQNFKSGDIIRTFDFTIENTLAKNEILHRLLYLLLFEMIYRFSKHYIHHYK